MRSACVGIVIVLLGLGAIDFQAAQGQRRFVEPAVSLELKGETVRQALDLLFRKANRTYRLDPPFLEVQGRIYKNIRLEPLSTALQSILAQARPVLAYRVVGHEFILFIDAKRQAAQSSQPAAVKPQIVLKLGHSGTIEAVD